MCVWEVVMGTEGDVLERGAVGRAELHPDAHRHQNRGRQHHIPQPDMRQSSIPIFREGREADGYLENSVNEAAGMTKIERKNNGRVFKVVI